MSGGGARSIDELGRRCANPYHEHVIASGERAIVVSATWSSATSTVCGWACLAAWTALMTVAQRAADHRELYVAPKHDGRTEASV
jgi:hypothetical protein